MPNQPDAQQDFRDLIDDMESDYQTLEQHYKGVSLFIESLFRPVPFPEGPLSSCGGAPPG